MIAGELQTKLLQRARRLYTLPEVALDVLCLTQSPLVDLSALRECIERDPALTSKILRLVNSSLFGRNRGIANLQQALSVLGINPLKMLVLGLNLPSTLFLNMQGDLLRKYWQKSLAKATLARELGRLTVPTRVDELFLAGLLGDVGTLLLIQELGEHYTPFLRVTLDAAQQREQWETAALGFDHAQLGAALLGDWKLSELVCRLVAAGTVEKRQRTLLAAELQLSRVLELADRMAWCWMENRDDLAVGFAALAEQQLQISTTQLTQVAGVVNEQLENLCQVFAQHGELAVDCERITSEVLARLADLSTDQVARELRSRQLQHSEERCDAASHALREKVPHAWRSVKELLEEQILTCQNAWPAMTLSATETNFSDLSLASATFAPNVNCDLAGPALAVEHLRPLLSQPSAASSTLLRPSSSRAATTEIDTANVSDPGLRTTLTTTILQCRQKRSPLSLILIALPGEPEIPRDQPAELLYSRLRKGDLPGQSTLTLRPREFAVLLPDCERRSALQWAGEILRELQHIVPARGLSIGVASIAHLPRNFAADQLINAARRCLDGAILSGGNTVKSIEVS